MEEHHLTVARRARYFALGSESAAEKWLVCHGYGQPAREFLEAFEVIAAPTRRFVAPEALSRFYLDPTPAPGPTPARVGASWMTREDRDNEIADQIDYLDAVAAEILRGRDRTALRLRALGFSQGVATVARWMAAGHVPLDDAIFWAGSLPPELDLDAMRPRVASTRLTLVVGTRDKFASWTKADAEVARFAAHGIALTIRSFDGGHRLDDDTLRAVATDA